MQGSELGRIVDDDGGKKKKKKKGQQQKKGAFKRGGVGLGLCPCGACVCVRCQALVDLSVPGARFGVRHRCPEDAAEGEQYDKKTQELMAKLGKKCPARPTKTWIDRSQISKYLHSLILILMNPLFFYFYSSVVCQGCGKFVERTAGCRTMMCGTNAHGKVADALRNGGCALIFDWHGPCRTFAERSRALNATAACHTAMARDLSL